MDKWCAYPELASLLTEVNCAKWAETADHFTGVAEDPDKDAILEMLGDMFELESEVLQVEQLVSGCSVEETEAAITQFSFESGAVVMHTKWLGYNRKSDITITACEADGGTIDNTLWFREMSRFKLWIEEKRIKIAKKWGKSAEYNAWWGESAAD
jgi:hypothetical protein